MDGTESKERDRLWEWKPLVAAATAVWAVVILLALGAAATGQLANDCSPSFWAAVATIGPSTLPPLLLWALLTPPILWLADRARRRPPGTWWLRAAGYAALALAAAVVMGLFRGTSHNLLAHQAGQRHPWDEWLLGTLVANVHVDLFIYGAVFAAGLAWSAYGDARRRKAEVAELAAQTAQLETQLAEAKLEALRHQLHPHFLFNTLNTISALAEGDPAASRRVVSRLSDLLRRALDSRTLHEVPLAEELRFLESYLGIVELRYGDRLQSVFRVPESLMEARVPNLLLQPLVENAVCHGAARTVGPCRIEVAAESRGATLELTVRDDGPGASRPGAAGGGEGIGLANTRARLRELYGDEADLRLASRPGRGFTATITLPLRLPDKEQQARAG